VRSPCSTEGLAPPRVGELRSQQWGPDDMDGRTGALNIKAVNAVGAYKSAADRNAAFCTLPIEYLW
jgi:hypothetical protein